MRSKMPAVLLLLVCVLAGAGWHADEAARAVADHTPPGSHEHSLGLTPYDGGVPTVQAVGGAQLTSGSTAVLASGSWPVRPPRRARAETGRHVPAVDADRSVAPARAPPGSSTR